QVAENTAIASRSRFMTAKQREPMQARLKDIKHRTMQFCTGCGYCMPCPNGVDIPTNLLLLNYNRLYGGFGGAFTQMYHQKLKPAGSAAEFCIECGECLEKCPQNIPISDRMQDISDELSKEE
ncbi:MAG: 4Fe-4S dicluster domain-containing protein, partial [Desulfobacterales bacterium]